jgi:large subunit ribosomal protein L17
LFRDVAAKVGDRPGGYTRIKVGNRLGDNADDASLLISTNFTLVVKEVKKAKADVVEKLKAKMRLLKLRC